MQSIIFGVATLLSIVSCVYCGIYFYPYGPGAGDSQLVHSANPAAKITLRDHYIFYGEDFKGEKLCIQDNGYITFKDPLTSNKPKPFPITVGMEMAKRARMVAPYWSDIDTRCGGDIYYRQEDLALGHPLIYIIKHEVNLTGIASDFEAMSAVIVTWEGVMCTSDIGCTDPRRNSIQLVITTDGLRTFTMFRYKYLEWSMPQSQPSTSLPHMATGPATAGINAGDRVNGRNVTNDPENIIKSRLVSMTNVGYPGLFVYRLDLGPSTHVRTVLMGKMMEAAVAETMQFGVSETEDDLYSPYADIAASEFNRQPVAHHEEYIGGLTATTESVTLYPYGEDDSTLGRSDEGTSGFQWLPKPISFYGKNYDKLVVYADGFLTLGSSYPDEFPAFVPRILKTTKVPIVAPYFADADPKRSGEIYFRVADDSSLLERAAEDINHVFHDSFSPKQLFIATWDKIGFYHHHDDLLNTFQAIIASDSQASYVIFIYKRVEWSSPDNTGVYPGSGVGAESSKLPILGISNGETHEQLVKGSNEPRDEHLILNVETEPGNTGVKGMWIFKATTDAQTLSNANVQSPQFADPKMQYSEYHRPSRPYLDSQTKSEIESLASELQDAKKHLG